MLLIYMYFRLIIRSQPFTLLNSK